MSVKTKLDEETIKIKTRKLNDIVRTALGVIGKFVVTLGVDDLPPKTQSGLREALEKYNYWNTDNDPYGTHEFGVIYGHKVGDKVDWHYGVPRTKEIQYIKVGAVLDNAD